MGREFQPAIPRQGGHQSRGQSVDAPRERPDDRLCVFPRDPDQADVARTPLDQRRDIGIARAHEQIAFPVPVDGAVLDGGRSFTNRDGPDDVAARLRRCGTRTSHRASLAQLRLQRLFEHAAALDEQAQVDRFVRHVHRRIIRIRQTEPAGDLLRRPLERELGGHRVT